MSLRMLSRPMALGGLVEEVEVQKLTTQSSGPIHLVVDSAGLCRYHGVNGAGKGRMQPRSESCNNAHQRLDEEVI